MLCFVLQRTPTNENNGAVALINKRIVLAQPTVILVSYDGFRVGLREESSYSKFEFYRKYSNGIKAKHLLNTFVTKRFPNHFTLVTGLYEESHGIAANTFFDPVFNDTFYLDAVSKHYGAPVWITNQKAFKKSAVVFWPGSEVKIEGQYPTHYLPYNRSLSFEKRIDYLCTMLEQDDPPSFLAAYFNEPGHSGHKFGPNSPEIKCIYIRRS